MNTLRCHYLVLLAKQICSMLYVKTNATFSTLDRVHLVALGMNKIRK